MYKIEVLHCDCLTIAKPQTVRQTKAKTKTLEEFKEQHYGKRGTPKRDKLEKGFEAFKLGALLHEARLKKGLTQEQLAERCSTNKACISRIENNVKEVRISTLQKIVEKGLGGQLNLSVTL